MLFGVNGTDMCLQCDGFPGMLVRRSVSETRPSLRLQFIPAQVDACHKASLNTMNGCYTAYMACVVWGYEGAWTPKTATAAFSM